MAAPAMMANPVAPRDGAAPTVAALALVLLVLPWIWPFASGPSPAVLPWLASATCALGFVLLAVWFGVDVSRSAAQAWLIAAIVSGVIGYLQFFGVSASFKPWINVTPVGEAFGNLRQRNQFASLTNIGLAVVVWCPWIRRFPGQLRDASNLPGRAALRWLPTCALVLVLASANAATSSRTGLLQMLVLLLLAVVWRRSLLPHGWRWLVLAVAGYALASVVLPLMAGLDPFDRGIASRFGASGAPCGSRILLWTNLLHLIGQKPWFGWGWGELDYAHFTTLYPGPRFCDILDNAHNLPLHLAVEFGLPVALLASATALWLVGRARPWRETDATRQMAWAVLAMIALHSLLEYPLWYGPFQTAAVLAGWILWRAPAAQRSAGTQSNLPTADAAHAADPQRPAPVVQWTVTALVTLLLACAAYASWDYWRVSQVYRPPEQRAPAYRDGTLQKIQASWLFRNQVRFAALTTTDVHAGNAALMHRTAKRLLHFSPEPRVIEKVIASARLLQLDDEAHYFLERYRAAFPTAYAKWQAAHMADAAAAPSNP